MATIELRHRSAEEVIPIVEPMLGSTDAISGQAYNIFLRSSPETLARVRSMIEVLDVPAKTLQISVFQGSSQELGELGIRGSLQLESGNASIRVGSENDDSDAGTIGYESGGSSASVGGTAGRESVVENPVYQVRVAEGTEAYIQTGEQVPYSANSARHGVVEYRDVTSGFFVVPRMRGDNVSLEISSFRNTQGHTSSVDVDTRSTTSTVNGPMGKWLMVGGIAEQATQYRREIGSVDTTRNSSDAGTWIRADLVR